MTSGANQPLAGDDLPYTVGVVVTTTANGADYADAASIAELAVNQALRAAGEFADWHITLTATARDGRTWPVIVQRVEPIDQFFRRGHAYVQVVPPRPPEETHD